MATVLLDAVFIVTVASSPDISLIDAVIFGTAATAAALGLGLWIATRRSYLAALRERAERLERELDQQHELAVATERARMTREMHDIVAHSLSVMIALNDGAAAAMTRDPEAARTTISQSSTLGRQALGEIRRLLGDEHSPGTIEPDDLAPQPGLAQLDDLVAQVRAAGLPVDLVVAEPLGTGGVLVVGGQGQVVGGEVQVLLEPHAGLRQGSDRVAGRRDVDQLVLRTVPRQQRGVPQ